MSAATNSANTCLGLMAPSIALKVADAALVCSRRDQRRRRSRDGPGRGLLKLVRRGGNGGLRRCAAKTSANPPPGSPRRRAAGAHAFRAARAAGLAARNVVELAVAQLLE